MKVGCPKEIKPQEFRVGLTPVAVRELVGRGHVVTIETNAGLGAGFVDSDYVKEGAAIVGTAKEVFDEAEMIVKVKEPQAVERQMLKSGQLLSKCYFDMGIYIRIHRPGIHSELELT